MTNTRPATTIRPATYADRDAVTTLLVEAFLESPIGDWLIPDLANRRQVYIDYFRIHVDDALADGIIDVTAGDLEGAALWYPRIQHVPSAVDYDIRLAAACGKWLERFQLIDELFGREHPDLAHHYLAFVGVHPSRQREGIGSALLDHHHAELDAHDLPAYLEASTEQSRDLYVRHGYALAASAPLYLPNGPPLWPMWREPAAPPPVIHGPRTSLTGY